MNDKELRELSTQLIHEIGRVCCDLVKNLNRNDLDEEELRINMSNVLLLSAFLVNFESLFMELITDENNKKIIKKLIAQRFTAEKIIGTDPEGA